MQNFYDLSNLELKNLIYDLNLPEYRVRQIWDGIYKQHLSSWNDFTNIPNNLKEILINNYSLRNLNIIDAKIAHDQKSEKRLFQLNDKNLIETVLISSESRNTLCISTQSGCAVGCIFCATGNMGFNRDLSSGEIIEQVLDPLWGAKHVDNIVLMGMGEPFLNYHNVMKAIRMLNHPEGLKIGARRFTVSTIGIPEEIRRFAGEGLQINLAVSLHAPTDELRYKLVPISKRYSLKAILEACAYFFEKTGRRITFEYVMIDKINDSIEQAGLLSRLLEKLNCHINLIPLNRNAHFSGTPSNPETITRFGKVLLTSGIATSIRKSAGTDILAGCGQLAATND